MVGFYQEVFMRNVRFRNRRIEDTSNPGTRGSDSVLCGLGDLGVVAVAILGGVLVSCGASEIDDPCQGTDCGAHGQCLVVGEEATCACEPGYKSDGSRCVASQRTKNVCKTDMDCRDNLFCNGEEKCLPNAPKANAFGCVSSEGPPCESGFTCDEDQRACLCADAAACDDDLFCNGAESCNPTHADAGANGCLRGTPPCDDTHICEETENRCMTRLCRDHEECDDGRSCNGVEQCRPNDGNATSNGCVPGIPEDSRCDDSVACTVDECRPDDPRADLKTGCLHTAAPERCDDGVDCTDQRCDPKSGCVFSPKSARCVDDDVACTVESCHPEKGCVSEPSDALCADDGLSCTVARCDRVKGCVHEARDHLCSDDVSCNGVETCDPTDDRMDGRGCVPGESTCAGDETCHVAEDACVPVDTDGDGIFDRDERKFGYDPMDPDSDDDGLTDGEEDTNRNGTLDDSETDPLNPDTDSDGHCDRQRVDNEGDGLSPASLCTGQEVIFVDAQAEAGGNGRSWATAFRTLSDASRGMAQNQELWIREGVYRPVKAGQEVLRMAPQTSVYGGFTGTETTRAQRPNPPARTVLDGDFDGKGAASDNSIHVVVGAAGRLDSVEIRGGYAFGSRTVDKLGAGLSLRGGEQALHLYGVVFETNAAEKSGGGLAVLNGTLHLSQVTFRENSAEEGGGGLAIIDANTTLSNVGFQKNNASFGGGLSTTRSPVTLRNVEFVDNRADTGAGLSSSDSAFSAENVTFTGNAAGRGGALSHNGEKRAAIRSSSFLENRASQGGAVLIQGPIDLTGTRIQANAATTGGGVYHERGEFTFSRLQFVQNEAENGAAISSWSSDKITGNKSVFAKNHSRRHGAGLHRSQGGQVELHQLTFVGNTAVVKGGAFFADSGEGIVRDVAFIDNRARRGGGLYMDAGLDVRRALFLNNQAEDTGGAVFYESTWMRSLSNTRPRFEEATFLANSAGPFAGALDILCFGISCGKTDLQLVNVLFKDNEADKGAAIRISVRTPELINTTFTGNASRSDFGGAVLQGHAFAVSNSIFWSNRGGDWNVDRFGADSPPLATFSHNCSQTEFVGVVIEPVTLTQDPFVVTSPDEVFLHRDPSVGCLDRGANDLADSALPEWQTLSTAPDLSLDGNDDANHAQDVDPGRHYHPDRVRIVAMSIDENVVTWETRGANHCVLVEDGAHTSFVPTDALQAGHMRHHDAQEVWLICYGQDAPHARSVRRGTAPATRP